MASVDGSEKMHGNVDLGFFTVLTAAMAATAESVAVATCRCKHKCCSHRPKPIPKAMRCYKAVELAGSNLCHAVMGPGLSHYIFRL